MKTFEDEVEFKKYLDTLGVRYGELDNTWRFYVDFIDNKGAALMTYAVARTPIAALRSLPELIKKYSLPPEDCDVIIRFCFRITGETIETVPINTIISPYMYFKKEEVKTVIPDEKSE